MKVLMENFSENIRDQNPNADQLEQFHYRQEEQEKEEDALRNAVIQKQQTGFIKRIFLFLHHYFILESVSSEVLQTLKLRAEIKTLALTLYLGESDMVSLNVFFS